MATYILALDSQEEQTQPVGGLLPRAARRFGRVSRYIEEKGRLAPDEFVEPMDLGAAPTNPDAAKPARYRVPKGKPGAGRFVDQETAYREGYAVKPFEPGKTPGVEQPAKGSNKPPTEPRGPQPRQHHVPFDRTPGEGPGDINVPRGQGGKARPGESEARQPYPNGVKPTETGIFEKISHSSGTPRQEHCTCREQRWAT